MLPLKNFDGFINVVILILLPVLLGFLSLIAQLVFITELKSEFRFNCINGSLAVLKTKTLSLEDVLKKLESMKSPLRFSISLPDFPDSETETKPESVQKVVFRLKYEGLSKPLLTGTVICGIERTIKEGIWHYQSIYSTKEDKF